MCLRKGRYPVSRPYPPHNSTAWLEELRHHQCHSLLKSFPFPVRPQNPWYRRRQCTEAGIPASPFPGAWQGTAEASCWPPVGMKSHWTPPNVCSHHGARCRVNDSKLKIKKRFFFFSSFLCVSHSVCFTCSYRCTKIYTTSFFAVFKSLMFDWPYTKFWTFSHIHLWENHWWLFFENYWKIYMYTPFLWI